MLFFMVPLKWQEAPVLCDTRLFRLARIPLIEKKINRRARGLIKFYDRRRYAGAYDRIIYDISSSPRDPRDQSWCAFFLSLSVSVFLSLSLSVFLSLFLPVSLSFILVRLVALVQQRSYRASTKTTGAGNHRPPRCHSEIHPDSIAVTSSFARIQSIDNKSIANESFL